MHVRRGSLMLPSSLPLLLRLSAQLSCRPPSFLTLSSDLSLSLSLFPFISASSPSSLSLWISHFFCFRACFSFFTLTPSHAHFFPSVCLPQKSPSP
ncbi:hypothetical protein BDY24DRAFT_383422 [Mrakia frigida]|uniref:uncharacterized protein n=1 Tax=Mrakia frigida TaxID=29902 RepID=UPI003FCC08C0